MIAYLNGRKIKGVEFNESGGLDFSVIGYDETPDYLQDGMNYAIEVKNNWKAGQNNNMCQKYANNKNLVFYPKFNGVIYSLEKTFMGCDMLQVVDLDLFDTSTMKNMSGVFQGCESLVHAKVNKLNTSAVTNMSSAFERCKRLKSLDVSNWNTSAVTNMENMFSYCENLTSLELSNFDTSNVTKMDYMFQRCSGLTSLNVSNFDTSNVTSMSSMFSYCSKLKSLDISNFDTSNVTSMSSMFYYDESLETLNMGNFDLSSLKTWSSTFYNLYKLRKIVWINTMNSPNNLSLDLKNSSYLGVNSEEVPDAREALTTTFVNNLFDRVSAGFPTSTLKFHANTKALLSEDEIAEITSKGFTIA